ncbi:MAG: class I SAM-dependent methyltransferase [Actinomycetota bacterium]|nr:class I SAM-dependent methyltransferase [Actinomycetota bacterium]MDQ2846774.1 class I SAM-dependent methyltransferase [Actinomycetota bacterium]MDQ2958209.1 class I SAM-dependent methyltransferase [Actinomycetota bacterium]
MTQRSGDGSAGDADYGLIGTSYSDYRRPDPRIAQQIVDALGPARTVLNVGAGAGSYEPIDRSVTAVEPSSTMRDQRPSEFPRAIDATAEDLPFSTGAFDAAMTIFSIHQWSDLAAGLAELRRVTVGPVVILTCDPTLVERFWLADYAPDVLSTEARRCPSLTDIGDALGGTSTVGTIAIPLDCTDGFNEAYYGRPELLLDPAARSACSAWSFVTAERAATYTAALRGALDDGRWDSEHAGLRTQPAYDGSLVLLVNYPATH